MSLTCKKALEAGTVYIKVTRERHAGRRQIMGAKTCIGNGTALSVLMREACVFKRGALKCPN